MRETIQPVRKTTGRTDVCKVCSAKNHLLGRNAILDSYEIQYFHCEQCGFVQTEEPFWLDEAYKNPIATLDIGLLGRNLRLRDIASRVLNLIIGGTSRCVDYGGGYGVFVRLMRDNGFDFAHFDPMADNLFASHFTASLDDKFTLVTAFEVLEHLADPHEHFAKLDRLAPNWLITTEMIAEPPPSPDQWWYYLPETGQHVSFYSKRSLQFLARQYNRRLITCGNGLHFFTRSTMPDWRIRWVLKNRTSRWLDIFTRKASLLPYDFELMRNNLFIRQDAA